MADSTDTALHTDLLRQLERRRRLDGRLVDLGHHMVGCDLQHPPGPCGGRVRRIELPTDAAGEARLLAALRPGNDRIERSIADLARARGRLDRQIAAARRR